MLLTFFSRFLGLRRIAKAKYAVSSVKTVIPAAMRKIEIGPEVDIIAVRHHLNEPSRA